MSAEASSDVRSGDVRLGTVGERRHRTERFPHVAKGK